MAIVLRELEEFDEAAFRKGLHEARNEDPHWFSFIWKEGMSFGEMLRQLADDTAGRNLPPDRVPHTMLYAFLDGEIIGRVSVRHRLNERLRLRGGHIGYWVAEAHRRKGHATEMVRLGLAHCKKLGIDSVMVTCGDTNVPSWKIIENFGGRLEDRIWDEEDKESIRRYWIALEKPA